MLRHLVALPIVSSLRRYAVFLLTRSVRQFIADKSFVPSPGDRMPGGIDRQIQSLLIPIEPAVHPKALAWMAAAGRDRDCARAASREPSQKLISLQEEQRQVIARPMHPEGNACPG
jgi:hypothetical protein